MKPRRLQRYIAWLLPLFVLRAFLPAGFMLAPSVDGLQVVLCAGTGPADRATHAIPDEHSAHSGHAHVTSTETSPDDHSAAHQSSLCVFAVGGIAKAPAPQMTVLVHAPVTDAPTDFVANPELAPPAILIDRIRGPPNA